MTTIPTPTSASLNQARPTSASSSQRTSLETSTRSSVVSSPALQPSNIPPAQPAQARRNRAALRDYYGLKNPPVQHHDGRNDNVQAPLHPAEGHIADSELDAQGFDAQNHVKELFEQERLEGVLKAEASLVSEIKSLDGDRKALVYDNYSKLITATDTIRRMRANMDPLTPTTSTLAPAISHIAGTAEGLASMTTERVADREGKGKEFGGQSSTDERHTKTGSVNRLKRRNEVDTVRWVLGAPIRYQGAVDQGRRPCEEKDWQEVRSLLESWHIRGVRGAQEIIKECESIFES